MKTLTLTLIAFAAAFVSSETAVTPASAHSDNACVQDVYDFCGASDKPCRIAGALACQNHHASGGTPPPPPDAAYSAPSSGGPSYSIGTPKLKMQAQPK